MVTRAVLFDFYGTLAASRSGGGLTHAEVVARHGYVLPDDVRSRWTSDHFDGREHLEHSASRDRYVAWERDRLRRMVLECGVGEDDADRLVDDLHATSKSWVLEAYDEVPDVLSRLARAGVRVVVCSNWDWDLDRAVEAAGLTRLVDVQVTSAQAGARKPHPRIFRHALAAAEVEPEEALFVGDSWRADVEGSLAVGLQAVHVWRADEELGRISAEPPPLPPGAHRVPDLRGVLDLL